jgi:hypothetical protein
MNIKLSRIGIGDIVYFVIKYYIKKLIILRKNEEETYKKFTINILQKYEIINLY